jgi:uncharacterized protein
MEQNIQVWYHSGCMDGFGAAWAAWRFFGQKASYIPVSYSQNIPQTNGCTQLYIVDFSYRPGELSQLHSRVPHITILDHHASAEEYLREIAERPADSSHLSMDTPPAGIFCSFNMEESGASLSWQYFHGDVEWIKDLSNERTFIAYLRDRDLWKFELPQSKVFSIGMQSRPHIMAGWDVIARFRSEQDKVKEEGRIIEKHQQHQMDMICRNTVLVDIGKWLRIPCVNTTVYASEIGEKLCMDYLDAPFSLSYRDIVEKKREWSIRSRQGFDCREVAEMYGGGGHKGAAGFYTTQDFYFPYSSLIEEDRG